MNPTVLANMTDNSASNTNESLSLWLLFYGARPIVQLITIGLLMASFWCWTIIIYKFLKLRKLLILTDRFEENFWSGKPLEEIYKKFNNNQPEDPMSYIFWLAMREWKRSFEEGFLMKMVDFKIFQQRIERIMRNAYIKELDKLERNIGFLASTGSTAPFIGLLGTVLGIIYSFQEISRYQNASLIVVAPGISEALFVTAIGLFTAIPSIIAYNKITNELNRYANRLEIFISEFSEIMCFQIEEVNREIE